MSIILNEESFNRLKAKTKTALEAQKTRIIMKTCAQFVVLSVLSVVNRVFIELFMPDSVFGVIGMLLREFKCNFFGKINIYYLFFAFKAFLPIFGKTSVN